MEKSPVSLSQMSSHKATSGQVKYVVDNSGQGLTAEELCVIKSWRNKEKLPRGRYFDRIRAGKLRLIMTFMCGSEDYMQGGFAEIARQTRSLSFYLEKASPRS